MSQSSTPTAPANVWDTKLFALLFGLVTGASIILIALWALKTSPAIGDPAFVSAEIPFAQFPTDPAGPADMAVRPPTNPNPPADR